MFEKFITPLAEFFGAKLKGIPWMEVLNLCAVGARTPCPRLHNGHQIPNYVQAFMLNN